MTYLCLGKSEIQAFSNVFFIHLTSPGHFLPLLQYSELSPMRPYLGMANSLEPESTCSHLVMSRSLTKVVSRRQSAAATAQIHDLHTKISSLRACEWLDTSLLAVYHAYQ